jgi:hypothetical protein
MSAGDPDRDAGLVAPVSQHLDARGCAIKDDGVLVPAGHGWRATSRATVPGRPSPVPLAWARHRSSSSSRGSRYPLYVVLLTAVDAQRCNAPWRRCRRLPGRNLLAGPVRDALLARYRRERTLPRERFISFPGWIISGL